MRSTATIRHPVGVMKKPPAVLAAVILALVLAACGGGEDAGPAVHTAADGTSYNDADVAFATAMVPHLAETVQYVVLADDRPLSDDARVLANEIRAARVLDVEQLITWLNDWDQQIPETVLDHVNAGHGDEHAAGSEEVAGLEAASDEEFEARWLAAIADQLEEGVAIAEEALDAGHHEGAAGLAGRLVNDLQEQADAAASLR